MNKRNSGPPHTPGPWSLSDSRSTMVLLIDDKEKKAVGEVVFVDVRNPADASLIVMSPELLECLQAAFAESEKALQVVGIPMISQDWHDKTAGVLFKALGGVA